MNTDPLSYHQQRADHCRSLAEQARNPDIRQLHEQLAALHAAHASRYLGGAAAGGDRGAA